MRYISTFIFIICTSFIVSAQNRSEKNVSKLLGEWTIVGSREKTSLGEGKFRIRNSGANISPKIIFKNDYSALIVNSNGTQENYTWTITKNRITITSENNGEYFKIIEGEFILYFSEKTDHTQLELIRGENVVIFLTR